MKIAVIVLSLEGQSGEQETLQSLHSQRGIPEGYQVEVQLMRSRSEDFDTMAQMKNAALRRSAAEAVILVMAGEVWEEDRLCRLLCAPACSGAELLRYLAVHGDGDVTSFVLERQQLCEVGLFHAGLAAGEDYELLFRLAVAGGSVRILWEEPAYEKQISYELFTTYAYVIGKYSEELKRLQLFDSLTARRLEEAQRYGIQEPFVDMLQAMVGKSEAFWILDRLIEPILVLTGDPVCYGVLLDFAEHFSRELLAQGERVELFDLSSEPLSEINRYIGKHYKAVVGFQTGIFAAIDKNSDSLIMDMIYGRKYEFVYDHPLYLNDHLKKLPNNVFLLMQDADYADYVKKYYANVADACQLPPAGQQVKSDGAARLFGAAEADSAGKAGKAANYRKDFSQRSYDVSFIGSYFDYRERMAKIRELTGETKQRALKLLQRMKQQPNLTIEKAFEQILDVEQITYDDQWFCEELSHMEAVGHTIKAYYREQAIWRLLEANIPIHIFGDGWNYCRLKAHPCMLLHPTVNVEESLAVMADSKISLNVMSWHKAGMTERIANAMMNGALCLSDRTSYLREHFVDGRNIVLFDLEHLEELPNQVKLLLADEPHLERIAQAGCEEAKANHSWKNRVEDFLKFLNMDL